MGLIAYAICSAVILSPVWSSRVEPKWDGRDFNYPAFAYAAKALKDGRLPLWNPYTNCGEPFIADPAYLWYQPGAMAAALLRSSPYDGYMLFWACIWAWAGFGAFFLAAVLGAGPLGCFVAAIAFAYSGFFVGHGQHLPYLVTASWIPWVLALAHAAVARRSRPLALLAGTALGLSALGGYAGLVIFECLALPLWLSLAFLAPRKEPGRSPNVTFRCRAQWVGGVLAISAILLILIWSPSLYAFLVEARDFTDRTKPVSEELALYGNPFPIRATISFLFPQLVVEKHKLFPSDVSMTNAYLGGLALPFAFLGIVSRGRRRWWLLFFAGFWLWTSLGAAGGLRTVLHYIAPATQYMRHNAMLTILFLAPMAAAVGLGVTAAFSEERVPAHRALWGWFALVTVVAAGTMVWMGSDLTVMGAMAPAALGSLTAALMVLLLRRRNTLAPALIIAAIFVVDLAWHTRTNTFTEWQEPGSRPTLTDLSLREIERYGTRFDPLMPRRLDPFFRSSKLNLVNRFPVVEGYVALKSAEFDRLLEGPFVNVLASDRYWLSPSAWKAPDRAAGIAALATLSPSDPIPVLVDRSADLLPEAPVVPGHFGAVRVAAYEPERVEMNVEVPGSQPAILASTERLSPSWRVYVDGTERDPSLVNYFFRGVVVPPGSHRVVFRYVPRTFTLLLVVGYGTILIALAFAFWMWRSEGTISHAENGRH